MHVMPIIRWILLFQFILICDQIAVAQSSANTSLLLWSDPTTWGGSKPIAGEDVIVPEGTTIILDENTPSLGGITINGTLEFDRQNITLEAAWILLHGELRIGTEETPFVQQATITLTGDDPEVDIMNMGTRGILVMGGVLELHGSAPQVAWTKINQHASANTTSVELEEAVTWNTGDQIVIGPTDYYEAANGASISQRVSLTDVSGQTLTIDENLNAFRWGLLQYATPSGMSLTNGNLVPSPIADTDTTTTPRILDERAPVGNLSRNIVLQSPDDDLWNNEDFGFHVMIMGEGASARIDGVEFRRGGQAGRLRRYPFHWHMLSYSGTQTLDDATGQYIRNSTINSSKNRGIVIHGTNGVSVQNNVVFDIRGHGIFTENAVERRNIIDGNLVLHVRNPAPGQALKQHETGERGSSGFWISNPDNTVINNHTADNGTNGFWLAFPQRPWGESSDVLHSDGLLLNPSRLQFGVFDNNTTHSNRLEGIMLDNVEIDEDGNTFPHQYESTALGRGTQWPYTNRRRFALARYKTWKNGGNGIWDRGIWADNFEVVSADNSGRFFAGSGSDGIIERSLVVGTSLNHLMNGTDRNPFADFAVNIGSSTPAAFATYHSTFDIRNNIVVNFPMEPNTRSGMFATEDYYVRPVDKGHIRNEGNVLIDTHAGVRLQAPFDYFTLVSALWDPQGIWGPVDNYVVYNDPFLTHGKTITPILPEGSGAVSVPGPFYGFEGFVLHGVGDTYPQNQPYFDLMGLHVRRLNDDLEEVASWTVPEAEPDFVLQHMRDFATTPEGIYELTFPEEELLPTDFQVNVENMLTEDDTQIIGIQFDGSLEIEVRMQAYGSFTGYTQVNSFEEVRNSTGQTWWQDKANNLVWVKLQGGSWSFWTDNPNEDTPTMDELLYETTQLRIIGNVSVSNEDESNVPRTFALHQNYPNPFNPTTTIQFDVPNTSTINLQVIDIMGREVATLVDGIRNSGRHTVRWNASSYASGIYFLRLQSQAGTLIRKMLLVK